MAPCQIHGGLDIHGKVKTVHHRHHQSRDDQAEYGRWKEYVSGGPGSPGRHHSNKHQGESPGKLPVDCMGRPAVMSTMEPNVCSLVRETRKMTYTKEEKAAQLREAAGFATCGLATTPGICGVRGKKKILLHDSMLEVAFSRNADGAPKISGTAVVLEETYKDCGGMSSAQWHRRFDGAQSKQCVQEWRTAGKKVIQQTDLVLNNSGDDAHFIDPRLRTLYENAAGFGKTAAESKRVPKGVAETQANTPTFNDGPKESALHRGHASIKQNEKRAGVLSADLWRP